MYKYDHVLHYAHRIFWFGADVTNSVLGPYVM